MNKINVYEGFNNLTNKEKLVVGTITIENIENEISAFENYHVVKRSDEIIKFLNCDVNEFVSIKRIKEEIIERKIEEKRKILLEEQQSFLKELFERFHTSLYSCQQVIDCLMSGKRIPTHLENAMEAVSYNQDFGTKSWSIFTK